MNYTIINETKISELALGLAYSGIKNSKKELFELLNYFYSIGGNILDTARVYSDWIEGEVGRSENLLGKYFQRNINRHNFILSTKGGHPFIKNIQKTRIVKECLKLDLELSLKALKTDYIDIYWLHRDNPHIPIKEIFTWLEEFKNEGKILHYGVSNWSYSRVKNSLDLCQDTHYNLFGNQLLFNITCKYIDKLRDNTMKHMTQNMSILHENSKLPLFAYSPFAGGFLFKKQYPINYNSKSISFKQGITKFISSLESKEEMISSSLKFLLKEQAFPVIPILGTNNTDQLKEIVSIYKKI